MLKYGITSALVMGTVMNTVPVTATASPVMAVVEEVETKPTLVEPIVLIGGVILFAALETYNIMSTENLMDIECVKIPFLPDTGLPNSVVEKIHPKTGAVIQRRYYDSEGRVRMDIDFTDHGYPDDHPWKDKDGRPVHKHIFQWDDPTKKKRSKGLPLTNNDWIIYVRLPESFKK